MIISEKEFLTENSYRRKHDQTHGIPKVSGRKGTRDDIKVGAPEVLLKEILENLKLKTNSRHHTDCG